MSDTLIPYLLAAGLFRPAPVYLLDIADDASTSCTGEEGDRSGTVCLCHWAPWFDYRGRPEDGPDPHYQPPLGDPLADLPAAEPWQPRARVTA